MCRQDLSREPNLDLGNVNDFGGWNGRSTFTVDWSCSFKSCVGDWSKSNELDIGRLHSVEEDGKVDVEEEGIS